MERIILGIDPGNYKTGYALLSYKNNSPYLIKSGVFKLPKTKPKNLKYVFESIKLLIEEYRPTEIALESSFYGKNPQTLIRLGELRGVILLISSIYEIPIFEYTPQQVKNSITGYGWAKKEDVLGMVERFFQYLPESYDEADAIATAFCHFINLK